MELNSMSVFKGFSLTVLISIAFASQAQISAASDCPSQPYAIATVTSAMSQSALEAEIKKHVTSDQKIPIEIERINSGAIFFFQGALINDGLITWYAFDLDRNLFIAVLGGAGSRFLTKERAAQMKLDSNQFVRYTASAGYSRSEFVTMNAATDRQRNEFICAANRFLTLPKQAKNTAVAPPPPMHAIAQFLSLLHNGVEVRNDSAGLEGNQIKATLEKLISMPLQTSISKANK
jgi:hypothetical protein